MCPPQHLPKFNPPVAKSFLVNSQSSTTWKLIIEIMEEIGGFRTRVPMSSRNQKPNE